VGGSGVRVASGRVGAVGIRLPPRGEAARQLLPGVDRCVQGGWRFREALPRSSAHRGPGHDPRRSPLRRSRRRSAVTRPIQFSSGTTSSPKRTSSRRSGAGGATSRTATRSSTSYRSGRQPADHSRTKTRTD